MARQNSCVSVNNHLFEKVLESLCNARSNAADNGAEELSRHEEREQALLDLLDTGALDRFNEDRLLSLCKSAKFFHVSEMIYQRRKDFGGILDCYCLDSARQSHVFSYIKQTVTHPNISVEEKKSLRDAVLERIEGLICINAEKALKLVTTNLGIGVIEAVNQVIRSHNQAATFNFLHCLFETTDNDWQFDASVYEQYVELLCQRSMVDTVVTFLRSHDTCQLSRMLDICQQFHASEAVVILLEKTGDVSGAFRVALRLLRTKLSVIVPFNNCKHDQIDQLKAARDVVESVISLLNRSSHRLEEPVHHQLWLTLFDLLIENYNRLFVDSNARNFDSLSEHGSTAGRYDYRLILQYTVSCMVSCVPFAAILDHLVTHCKEDGIASCFGNVRDLLTSIMDACRYQQTLYMTCSRIVHKDVNGALSGLTIAAQSPTSPRSNTCSACQQHLSELNNSAESDVVCFHCGHAFHQMCLRDSMNVGKDVDEHSMRAVKRLWHCLICCRSQTASTLPYVRSRVSTGSGQSECDTSQPLMSLETASAVDQLRQTQQTASRFEILSELNQLEASRTMLRSSSVWNTGNSSALRGEKFSLKLAPPPAQ